MVIGLTVTVFTLGIIIYHVVQTERSKQDIMSIFALLSLQDVKEVYDICDQFIDRFDNNEEVMGKRTDDEGVPGAHGGGGMDKDEGSERSSFDSSSKEGKLITNQFENGMTSKVRRGSKAPKQANESSGLGAGVTEEFKDDSENSMNLNRTRGLANKFRKKKKKTNVGLSTKDYYSRMLKRT